jgi:hypothetical protein
MDKLVFEKPLLKYIASFNVCDNKKQGNTGIAFCFIWLPGLCEASICRLSSFHFVECKFYQLLLL